MTLPGFVTYALALGIAAAVPGPGVVALVARALGSGFRPAMAFLAGLILGDLTYLAAATFGLALIAESLGEVFVVIRMLAGLYLAYLAYRLWHSGGARVAIEGGAAEPSLASFAAGITITLGNPKTIVFYLAVLPTILDLHDVSAADFAALVAVTTLILFAVLTPYAGLAARARGSLRRPVFHRRLDRGAAAIMAGAAVWTVVRRS